MMKYYLFGQISIIIVIQWNLRNLTLVWIRPNCWDRQVKVYDKTHKGAQRLCPIEIIVSD